MPFELDLDLPPALAPLAWLVGHWEGTGVVGYPTIESATFAHEITCSHDGRPFLEWHSHTWLLDEKGERVRPLATELGFWRPLPDGEVELVLSHATGIVELYYGRTSPAKVELSTDGVIRSPHAKEYAAGSRLYGLVNSNLMWAMDMAAMGQQLQSHLSGELKRV
ncbi:FABP family protein [Luteipulveratus mongoliensis]|uniref:Peroxynitrite isomerase n=1 Tax=Luteipulveratus mongoliensis TaxID=571913 RepID=A0A0K1JG53_9MICO|nr:FABP family protein [Luteipulveratus mongoliensis]AKU15684.1 fatty acid-binding protein [Luteipulveratus mongoliensis]